MERTTIRLDEQLMQDAKREASALGETFTQYVADALREKIYRKRQTPRAKPYRVRVFKGGGGVRPGIDLTNNAALFDLMDEEDAASRR